MRAISDEKREMLVEAKLRGEKEAVIALWLKISKASVGTIWRNYRRRGSVSPIKNTGRPSRLSAEDTEAICQAVRHTPDITLSELIEKLSLPIKKSQLSRLLIRLGFRYKKNAAPKKPAEGGRAAEAVRVAQVVGGHRLREAGVPGRGQRGLRHDAPLWQGGKVR